MIQPLVIFLAIALIISAWGGFQKQIEKISLTQASVSQAGEISQVQEKSQGSASHVRSMASNNSYVSPTPGKSNPVSSVSIDTFIKFGPNDKEVISETNRVVFEFGAEVSPPDTEGQITFETKIEGFDDNWKETYGSQRTIDLPPGVKEYTFLVRAKINNVVDPFPAKRTFKLNISPYFAKVKISGVTPPDARANPSLITLRTEIEENEKINITGWKFEGEYGSFIVPQGIEEFNPLIRPLSLKDIIIKEGDRIYISSAVSPLGDKDFNFRTNKCMGYLVSFSQFPIPISKNCPATQILPSSLTDCCQEYIFSLGTCQVPTYQGIEKYELFKDSVCLSYMDLNLNYGGCYRNYYRDQNFWENQWHIYLNRAEKEIMDINVDTIYLRDRSGLLIDKYSYGGTGCCK